MGASLGMVRANSMTTGLTSLESAVTSYFWMGTSSRKTQSVSFHSSWPGFPSTSAGKVKRKIAVPPGSRVPPTSSFVVFSDPGVVRTPIHPATPSSRVTITWLSA
jgi:hypothetical protein